MYLDQGKFIEARGLFKEIYEHYGISKKGYLWRERWLRAGLQYVEVELKLGNLANAERYLKEIEVHFNNIPDFPSSPQEYYPTKLLLLKLKRQFSRTKGDFKQSDLLGEAYLDLKDKRKLNTKDKTLSYISLYPVPASDIIYIENPENIALTKATIYDLTGRVVKTIDFSENEQDKSVNVTDLASANYLLIIQTHNQQITKRIVIE